MPALSQLPDASIYGNQEAPKGSSLADLINIGKGSLELQKARELYEPSIEKAKAETRQAVTQADTSNLENILKHTNAAVQSQQRLLVKPDLKAEDILSAVKEHAKNTGAPEASVNQALAGLPQNGTPTELRGWLAQTLTKTLSNQQQLEKLYPGGVLPSQIPESYQPAVQKEVPTGGGSAPSEPFSQPEKLSYPVPVAGQPRAQLPSEEGDRQFGEKARLQLTGMQQSYPAIRQNYDKLIDQTQKIAGSSLFGGAAGTAERALKAKIGTPEYQQLSKDLANAQIAQIKAEGGSLDTVAGQSLSAHANGSVTYDPTVLLDIARRNAANLENKNAQANGLKVASEKFGDANAKHFLSMWNKNANDNSVFEMKYIFSHAKTPEEGVKEIQKYIKESGFSEAKRKELATKYLNLQKLETTGSL